jgi:hypothetical protein
MIEVMIGTVSQRQLARDFVMRIEEAVAEAEEGNESYILLKAGRQDNS